MVHLDRSLVFPAVNHIRAAVNKIGMRQGGSTSPLTIDCSHIYTSDFTAAEGFADLVRDFNKRGQTVLFLNMQRNVEAIFKGPDSKDLIAVIHGEDQLKSVLQGEFLLKGKNHRKVLPQLTVFFQNFSPIVWG